MNYELFRDLFEQGRRANSSKIDNAPKYVELDLKELKDETVEEVRARIFAQGRREAANSTLSQGRSSEDKVRGGA